MQYGASLRRCGGVVAKVHPWGGWCRGGIGRSGSQERTEKSGYLEGIESGGYLERIERNGCLGQNESYRTGLCGQYHQ